MLLVTPALLPEQEQEQEQDQEQEQEQDALLWNYFSTNLLVFLDQARPVVAQRNKSGRARASAGAACRLRCYSSTQSSFLLRARDDLSHLYRGMRLPPLSEHIKFHGREQRLNQHMLGTAAPKIFSQKRCSRQTNSICSERGGRRLPLER